MSREKVDPAMENKMHRTVLRTPPTLRRIESWRRVFRDRWEQNRLAPRCEKRFAANRRAAHRLAYSLRVKSEPTKRLCKRCHSIQDHWKGAAWCKGCLTCYAPQRAAGRRYEQQFTRPWVDGKRVRIRKEV